MERRATIVGILHEEMEVAAFLVAQGGASVVSVREICVGVLFVYDIPAHPQVVITLLAGVLNPSELTFHRTFQKALKRT